MISIARTLGAPETVLTRSTRVEGTPTVPSRWLLRLDTVPEFVQLIKLVQEKVDQGSERVRLPRLPVAGGMRECALMAIETAIQNRPGGAQ